MTAGHCVENIDPGLFTAADEFLVDHIDVSAATGGLEVATNAVVTGTWPQWSSGSSVAVPAGYSRTRFRCRARCGRNSSGAAAPCIASSPNLDIALLECPRRPSSHRAYWVYAGNTRALVGSRVQSYWYHEILDLPTVAPTSPDDRWDHYGRFDDLDGDGFGEDDNYHYTFPHLLWPLMSNNNATLGPATITGGVTSGFDYSEVSLFGCHGTSGAGVFARGSTALYGPAVFGAWTEETLCGQGLRGVNVLRTSVVQDRSEVRRDRRGLYTPSF